MNYKLYLITFINRNQENTKLSVDMFIIIAKSMVGRIQCLWLQSEEEGFQSWFSKTCRLELDGPLQRERETHCLWLALLEPFPHCARFPKLFISCWASCGHADTSAPLQSPPNALFILSDLFILCLFLPVLWCERNSNSIFEANTGAKNSFNESKY